MSGLDLFPHGIDLEVLPDSSQNDEQPRLTMQVQWAKCTIENRSGLVTFGGISDPESIL